MYRWLSQCKIVLVYIWERSTISSLKESLEPIEKFCPRPGLLYAVLSCFFFATSSVLVHVVDEIHAVQTVFFRSFIQLLFTVPMLIFHGINPLPKRENLRETVLLLFRGVTGSTAVCFQFYALQHMPLSDATVIIFSSPIFTGILAYYFLSERWSKLDAVSAALCFLGVVMIAQPGNFFVSSFQTKRHFMYCIVALNGAVLSSVSIIALKKLHDTHYVISSFYLALVGTVGTGFLFLIPGVFRPVVCGHQTFIVLIGLCAVGKYRLFTSSEDFYSIPNRQFSRSIVRHTTTVHSRKLVTLDILTTIHLTPYNSINS